MRIAEDSPSLSLLNRKRAGTLPSSSTNNSFLGRLAPLPTAPVLPNSSISTSIKAIGTTSSSDFPFAAINSSRLRSGSLTVPNSGLPNVFNAFGGSSGENWTPRIVGTSDLKVETRVDSLRGPDSSNFGDDSVRTLDYLGLQGDDSDFSPIGSGSNVESSQMNDPFAVLASDKTRAQGRLRSHTISSFPKNESFTRARGSTHSSSTTSNSTPSRHSADDELGQALPSSAYRHSSTGSTDSARLLYSTAPMSSIPLASDLGAAASVFRPRAATIGILDEQRDIYLRRRAGTMATLASSKLTTEYVDISHTTGSYEVESDQAIEEQVGLLFIPRAATDSISIF